MRYWITILFCLTSWSLAAPGNPETRDGRWLEVTTPHFRIYTNANEKSGRVLGQQMEKIRAIMALENPHYRLDPGRPLTIFAAKNHGSFLRMMGEDGMKPRAMWTNGVYREGILGNYMICRTDRPAKAFRHLLHEYVHLLHRINYEHMPLWLDEGLAEYYERSALDGHVAKVGFINLKHTQRLRGIDVGELSHLFETKHHSHNYQRMTRAARFYATSWALVHYLKTDELGQQRLTALLQSLAGGTHPQEATRQALGDTKALKNALQAYIDIHDYTHQSKSLSFKLSRKSFDVRVCEPGEILARKALYFADVGETEIAQSHIQLAQKYGHADKNHLAQSLISLQTRDNDHALEYAVRSIREGEEFSYAAHFIAGWLRGHSKGVYHLRKSLELRPDFAPAMGQLALFYADTDNPSLHALAAKLGRKALEPERGNVANQVRLVRVLQMIGDADGTIATGQAMLARNPVPSVRQTVQKAIYNVTQKNGPARF